MRPDKLLYLFMGAELFTLLRVAPGRGVSLVLLGSLALKNWLYPLVWVVPPPLQVVVHAASVVSVLWVLVSLLRRQDAWDTGVAWLSLGSFREKTTLQVIEPLAALLMMAACVLAVPPALDLSLPSKDAFDAFGKKPVRRVQGVAEFMPVWTLYIADSNRIVRYNPDAPLHAFALPFFLILGLGLHTGRYGWPESAEYRAEERQRRLEQARARGDMTFSDVEDVR